MRSLATMLLSVLLVCTLAYSCRGGSTSESAEAADSIHSIPDTLRVGTLYSPLSYFIYREEQMGYDYDLIKQFGVDKEFISTLSWLQASPRCLKCSTRAKWTLPLTKSQ